MKRKFHLLLLAGILIFAGFLRIYKISDYMTFLGDEGRDVLVAYNILHGQFTLLGPTSSVGGFFLGPIYYYFMTPFLWLFNYDPVGPAVMVALFGVATVWLVYKIGSEFFDKKTGLIAAFLYSISPLVIAYSRSSWNPNLMPFFSLLNLYILYKAIKRNNIFLFIFSGILFGITMQLHYVALFLVVILVVYIAFARTLFSREKNFLVNIIYNYALFFIGFIVGISPFLAFEVRHGFPNERSIFNFILYSGETGTNGKFFDTVGNVFFRIFGRLLTNFPPPEQVGIAAHLNITIWYFATILLGLASVFVFILYFKEAAKRRDVNFLRLSLLFIWFFLGILIFGFYKKPIYDYYFGFIFPLPFLLVGNLISTIYDSSAFLKIKGKAIAIVILLVLVGINLWGIPFRFSANKQKDQAEKISNFVLSKTEGKPFNFALITLGNSDHTYRYFFKLEGKDPVVIQNPQLDPKRESVTNQLLVICEDPNCQPLGNSLWEVAGFGRAEISGVWNVSVVKVYKLTHYIKK